jgi:hypothetical protein
MNDEYLSPHFTLQEMIFSDYALRNAIDNTPDAETKNALSNLCNGCLEKARALFNEPVIITSGYRSIIVNHGIGGAQNPISQHTLGEAADFHVMNYANMDVVKLIVANSVLFDQLIFEGTWVHISFTLRHALRRQVLSADFSTGKAVYSPLAL